MACPKSSPCQHKPMCVTAHLVFGPLHCSLHIYTEREAYSLQTQPQEHLLRLENRQYKQRIQTTSNKFAVDWSIVCLTTASHVTNCAEMGYITAGTGCLQIELNLLSYKANLKPNIYSKSLNLRVLDKSCRVGSVNR